ncbi:DUF354 domain-containing protein [Marinobacter sp. JSM 1782161]|uniref:DUF354 domain-containing protein n=1 Tax=Marinobacter sp. JSM 1782161 TaxID=2685906 RepID=UPI00140268FB|nr:DUF354 domain-containing protein [Marinobacter sp. JSM 1782161]
MKILIDVCHPAHAHFFRNPIKRLAQNGHDVVVTSRNKEVTSQLLDRMGITHADLLDGKAGKGVLGLLKELVRRNYSLFKLVLQEKPDVMVAIGGIFIAQVGFFTRTRSVVFYDTENAVLQNFLTYPFASAVYVPECYESWLPSTATRYRGYHELSYLHPHYFTANRDIAIENGLSAVGDTYFIRVVSWQANHDIGESGWSLDLLTRVAEYLSQFGKVLISSEDRLPPELMGMSYTGDVENIHHVLGLCRLYVGESATMASESVTMGVPAIYAANTGRGYCNEQEEKYRLLKNVFHLDFQKIKDAVDEMRLLSKGEVKSLHGTLIESTIDVSEYVVSVLEKSS